VLYLSETIALWCPANRWIRKASVPASPNRLQKVCPKECKTNSAAKPSARRTFTWMCAKLAANIGAHHPAPQKTVGFARISRNMRRQGRRRQMSNEWDDVGSDYFVAARLVKRETPHRGLPPGLRRERDSGHAPGVKALSASQDEPREFCLPRARRL
jgi:hypothetical protein